jgi:hypothetical protein
MRSCNHGPSTGHTSLRHPVACIPSVRRLTHRPSRLMTPRPTRRHNGLGLSTPCSKAAHAAPLRQLWTCQTGHQSRRHPGVRHCAWSRLPRVPTPSLRARCRGPGATCHHPTCSSQHLAVCAITSPSREGTQRDESAQVSPPQTTPLLSVRGCEWNSNLLSSINNTLLSKRERTQVRLQP